MTAVKCMSMLDLIVVKNVLIDGYHGNPTKASGKARPSIYSKAKLRPVIPLRWCNGKRARLESRKS
jgi:hypothetical protein